MKDVQSSITRSINVTESQVDAHTSEPSEQNITDPDEYLKEYFSESYLKYKSLCSSCKKFATCIIAANQTECAFEPR